MHVSFIRERYQKPKIGLNRLINHQIDILIIKYLTCAIPQGDIKD